METKSLQNTFSTPRLVKRQMTQEILKEYLYYDPLSGAFTLLKTNSPALRNKVPCAFGSANGQGYLYGMLERVNYPLTKLAWLYMTGEFPTKGLRIDHKNRDVKNNSWENLRQVSATVNAQNQAPTKDSTISGVTGVSYREGKKSPYYAHIRVDKKLKHIGCFKTLELATAARRTAEKTYFN